MNEYSLVFGPDKHLLGTVVIPRTSRVGDVGFVLLNAGVIHRVGPHRINVKLARSLARMGIPVLRFDLSGLGDSRTARNAAPFNVQAVRDIQSAMDCLAQEAKVRRFVIAGICSGAHNGLAAAVADDRIAGLVMIDGYSYPTMKTAVLYRWRQLRADPVRSMSRWCLAGLYSIARSAVQSLTRRGVSSEVAPDETYEIPSREAFAAAMQRLIDRGVHVYLIYSASLSTEYNYPDQFRDAFANYAFVNQVQCDLVTSIDHTATRLESQLDLIARICAWAPSLDPR